MIEEKAKKKVAKTDLPLLEEIKNRWSPRAFDPDKPVPDDTLRILLEAARWAPSSYNEQPWRYFVGQKGDETWDKIFDCLVSFNQQWCKFAPVLIMTIAKDKFSRDGSDNRHSFHDVGQASAFMALQATREGVYLHQMAGFSPQKAETCFNIPGDYTPCSCIAVGYLGDSSQLPEDLQQGEEGERSRSQFSELVFQNKWGEPREL